MEINLELVIPRTTIKFKFGWNYFNGKVHIEKIKVQLCGFIKEDAGEKQNCLFCLMENSIEAFVI